MNPNCHVEQLQKSATAEELAATATIALGIDGMGCENCAMRVHNGLVSLWGVVDARVDHTTAMADIVFNPNLVKIVDLADAVAKAGSESHHRYRVLSVFEQAEG